jgi:uncharacterized membrane protein (UPF0127 family)
VIPLPQRHIASPGHVARPRRAPARVRALLGGALLLVGLTAACGGGSTSATAERSPTAVPTAPTIAASPPAGAAASPTPSTTVEPSPTPEPTPTAEPTPAEPVASTASIPLAELPRVDFVRADGSAVSLPVEIPPRSDYGLGLSGRYELKGRGMVFYYPQGTSAIGFYMKNTHIDLAIAFVGQDDRVIAIRQMVAESLDLVRPGGVYHYAVEAPAGWYAERGITEGALLRLPPGLELPE